MCVCVSKSKQLTDQVVSVFKNAGFCNEQQVQCLHIVEAQLNITQDQVLCGSHCLRVGHLELVLWVKGLEESRQRSLWGSKGPLASGHPAQFPAPAPSCVASDQRLTSLCCGFILCKSETIPAPPS